MDNANKTKDHPRIRGEKFAVARFFNKVVGSPPHTRGKVGILILVSMSRGITPAYAGKSLHVPEMTCNSWDHPRIRGEKAVGSILESAI